MATSTADDEFTLLLTDPVAYAAHVSGAGPDDIGALGISRRLRGAARGVRRGATRAGRGGLKLAAKAHPLALAAKGLAAATGPVRRRIFKALFGKLITRRARLLAWSRRRSLVPSPAENREARGWASAYVKRRGLLGKLVGTALSGDLVGEPATSALVTASVPVLIALAKRALAAAERHGAPADPRAMSPQGPELDPDTAPEADD
jgi:hypothetical protein